MLQFRRIISSESWVPEIDGLRFIAILSVLLFHITGEVAVRGPRPVSVPSSLGYLIGNGDRGVALFFVISGFVLARPFFQQHRRNGRPVGQVYYFVRRLTRLEPPFLLSLALYFLAFAAIHAPLHWLTIHTLASAAYLHNLIFPELQTIPNFVTWSLEVEVQFYILAPLLGQLYRVPNTAVRQGIWVALTLAGCLWSALNPGRPITLLTYAGFFPAGFLLADIFESSPRTRQRGHEHFLWDALGLAGWLTLFLLPQSLFLRGFLPVLIVPLYLTAFHGKLSRALFRLPLLTAIGGMCYSLYLLHPLVISVSFRVIRNLRFHSDLATFFTQGSLLLISTLVAGAVYFLLVERPFMKKRFVSLQRP